MHTLKNKYIQIEVNEAGAELTSIKRIKDNKDYMWAADPAYWTGYAPVLFPIIGALKNDTYHFNGKSYTLPRHGFVRNNKNVKLTGQTENSLKYTLTYDDVTLKLYPFQFELNISFILEDHRIKICHEIKNQGNEAMYFSLGAHPAFKCPVDEGESYNDCYIEFEHNEMAHALMIEPGTGLIGGEGELILDHNNKLVFHAGIFEKGALVFKNLKSRRVSLCSKKSGKHLTVSFPGFPYLGIWAKVGAPFVCIEPWMGIADSVDTNQDIVTKEGIIKLGAGRDFRADYEICLETV